MIREPYDSRISESKGSGRKKAAPFLSKKMSYKKNSQSMLLYESSLFIQSSYIDK